MFIFLEEFFPDMIYKTFIKSVFGSFRILVFISLFFNMLIF